MKVLYVTPVFYPAHGDGGPVTAFYELCRSLARLGCDVRVLATDAHGWQKALDVETGREIEFEKNLRIRYCKRLMRRSVAPSLLYLVPRYVQWADVIHLGSVYNFPTIPTLAACRIYKKPVVWSPDGALQRWEGTRRTNAKAIWEAICRAVAPTTLILHATSEQEAQESRKCFANAEVVVIPHGIPVPEQVTHVEGGGILRLLYLGRLDPIKGIENLAAACKILKDRTQLSWSLTIAGAGDPRYTAKLQETMQRLGFSPQKEKHGAAAQVQMVGHVVGDAKERLFQNSDILVAPSYIENFGVVVAEALAHEVPVIASTGTPWKRLEEMGCGLWVDNDPESLAKAIQQMSRISLPEMGRLGRKWARECFSGERVGRDMLACYKAATIKGVRSL